MLRSFPTIRLASAAAHPRARTRPAPLEPSGGKDLVKCTFLSVTPETALWITGKPDGLPAEADGLPSEPDGVDVCPLESARGPAPRARGRAGMRLAGYAVPSPCRRPAAALPPVRTQTRPLRGHTASRGRQLSAAQRHRRHRRPPPPPTLNHHPSSK